MAKFEFKFKPSYYTMQGAETLSRKDIKEMRREYTRMRDVAQKRIKRLGAEFDWTKSFSVHEGGIPKLKDLDPRDLAKAFKELASFVKWGGSTVSGQREMQRKTMETLSKAVGGDKTIQLPISERPVNPSNYRRVVAILEEARKRKITYGSDKIVELADATLDLDQKQFDSVLDHLGVFLEHSDEVEDAFNDVDYIPVDMEEFIEEIGW